MSKNKLIGIIAAPAIVEPITQQLPVTQGRSARRLHDALHQVVNSDKTGGYEVQLLDFVASGPVSSDSDPQRASDKVQRFKAAGGDYLSLSLACREWLNKREPIYRVLIAGTLGTAKLALHLRRNGHAEKVIYMANHLLRPLEHWGIPILNEQAEYESRCLSEVDAVVFPSQSHREDFLTYYPATPNVRTEFISHGVSPLGEEEVKVPKRKTELAVIFAASPVHPQSDYATALYALRRVVAACPERVVLKVSGSPKLDSPGFTPEGELLKIIGIANELNLLGNLEFLGYLSPEEMRTQYQKADVTIVSSALEGFGDVVSESLYEGTRVVATRTGAIPSFVRSEHQGYVVAPRSPWQMAQFILKVFNMAKSEPSLSKAKLERIREPLKGFTWLKAAEKYMSLFSDVLSRRYPRSTEQRLSSNLVRDRLKARLQARGWTIRMLSKELTGKSFESIRRVFDQDAAPNLRWSTVEPIAKALCDKREISELRKILERR